MSRFSEQPNIQSPTSATIISKRAAADTFQPVYINCGSFSSVRDSNGQQWQADDYFSGGLPGATIAGLVGGGDNRIFQTMRYAALRNSIEYNIPVLPNRMYEMTLYFTETFKWFSRRQIDVYVQHVLVFDNLEIVSDGTAPTRAMSVKTMVNGGEIGELSISIKSFWHTPSIAAIEIHDAPTSALGRWIEVDPDADLTNRHEACFVLVGRKAYLLAGRYRGTNAVDIYDPVTRTWSHGASPPIELHHTQCVAVDDKVWIVSSWTGGYPRENNTESIYIYNPATDSWSTKAGLPEPRRRGGAASILVGRRIYVSHGNRGGHETADFAVSLGWLDYYDIDADSWVTNLPDAPNPRDHTGGALINGRLCIAGGRDGGSLGFFNNVILPTDCFDLATNTWSVEADIPQGRAGSAYGTTCDGKLMIAGGEGFGRAWPNVDVFNGTAWTSVASLNVGRHGSGLAVDCICNQIHIASGASGQGGGSEIASVETYFPGGIDVPCPA